ncbi:hypothetical protein FOZ63_005088, partial [Perkinsus olseni]
VVGLADHAPISFVFASDHAIRKQSMRAVSGASLSDHNYYKCIWNIFKQSLKNKRPNYVDAQISSKVEFVKREMALVHLILQTAISANPRKRRRPGHTGAKQRWFDDRHQMMNSGWK